MLEKKIQERIIKKLKNDYGIEALKTIAISKNGYPDLIFPYKGRFFALEVKQPDGYLKALQAKKIDILRTNRAIAFVIDDVKYLDKVMQLHKIKTVQNKPYNIKDLK